MARGVLIIFFFLAFFKSYSKEWYHGTLTLRSHSTLKGELSIEEGYNVVLLKVGEEVSVVPAFKIAYMDLYDDDSKQGRRFVSLYIGIGAARTFQFFEVIVDGQVSVLRREIVMWYSLHVDMTDYDYYVLFDNELIDIGKFKKKVYPKINRASDGVLDHVVTQKKLSFTSLDDVIEIVRQYNVIENHQMDLARNSG